MHRTRLDLALGPLDVLRCFRGRDRLVALVGAWNQGEALIAFDPVRVLTGDPFAVDLEPSPDPGFGGGWIGAWGYRLGAQIERLPPSPPRPAPQPDHRVAFYDHVLRLADGTWWLESLRPDVGRDARIRAVLTAAKPPGTSEGGIFEVGAFEMTPGPGAHRAAVQRVLDHVRAGDIFQANVCTRLEASFRGDPLDVFCAGVERLRPAYGAFVSSPEGALASFSPELFVRRTGRDVLTSPIKGTAPLASDPADLLASAKDRAENVMIVDLMRNDLGRVSVPGSVRVPAVNRAERHAVWHLVSDVVGHLGRDVTDAQLLRATFPPGSVTGAPKVRAMEIIAEVEATGREAYTGTIGHVSPAAGLEMNVVIRTFEFAVDAVSGECERVWLGVGGGVVADSTPEGELAECLVKARPLIEAIGGRLDLSSDAPTVPVAVAHPLPEAHAVDLSRGVYDTLLVQDGRAIDVESHLARLDASVRSVFGTTIRAGLDDAVHRRVRRLTGRHRLRIDAVPRGDQVDVTMIVRPIDDDVEAWSLRSRVVAGGLGEHKWSDRSALSPVLDPAVDDLLVDTDGALLETGRASLFLVLDDGVHTPAIDGRILPGTARQQVVERLKKEGIPVFQRRLERKDLDDASEVFVTNALRGVVPVQRIDTRSWPTGRTTRWLKAITAPALGAAGSHGLPRSMPTATEVGTSGARVLFVDNYDSFVYNLVQYVSALGAGAEVVRHDAVSVDELVAARARGDFTHLIVSPGPGTPADAGISIEAIRRLGPTTPTLGVCLGHQAIAEAYGATVLRAPEVVHGKPSLVHHDGRGIFGGLDSPSVFARYHSLVVDEGTVPSELEVTARTAATATSPGLVMGLRHRTHPVEGVQMHPESILTTHGHQMIATFLDSSPPLASGP